MPPALDNPRIVDFPLRGEGWMAVTTPATRVPSHGVDMLGQRYAYDLLKVDQRSRAQYHPAGSLRGLLVGVGTSDATHGGFRSTRLLTAKSYWRSTESRSEPGSIQPGRPSSL